MSNIQKAHAPFAGLKKSKNGRTLITKMYNMAGEGLTGNVTFTDVENPDPSKTPEFHETLRGINQACVEKGATNLIPDFNFEESGGRNGTTGWYHRNDGFWTKINDYEGLYTPDPENDWGRPGIGISGIAEGSIVTFSVEITKMPDTGSCSLYLTSAFGGSPNDTYGFSGGITESGRYSITAQIAGDNYDNLVACYINYDGESPIQIKKPQVEIGEYPTLFTEGTRPSITPSLPDDTLEDTGYFAFTVDAVKDTSTGEQYFFDTAEADDEERSFLKLTDQDKFYLQIYGNKGGHIEIDNPFDWDEFSRQKLLVLLSWNNSTLMLWLSDEQGNVYSYFAHHTINTQDTPIEIDIEEDDITGSNLYGSLETGEKLVMAQETFGEIGSRVSHGVYSFEPHNFTPTHEVKFITTTEDYIEAGDKEGLLVQDAPTINDQIKGFVDGGNYQNILKAYSPHGMLQTSVVDGRRVIDKMSSFAQGFDIEEWAGNDRPELHQNQACVEKEVTNEFRDSDPATDPGQGTRSNVTFAVNDWGITYGGKALNGKVIFGDNSSARVYWNTGSLDAETIYTISFLIKPDDGIEPTFGGGSNALCQVWIGGAEVDYSELILEKYSEGIWLLTATSESTNTNLDRFGPRKSTGNNAIGFECTGFQVEQGSYATLYIPTTGSAVTRPAPAPVIENALPETGTVAGVINKIMSRDGIAEAVYGNDSSDERAAFFMPLSSSDPNGMSFELNGEETRVREDNFPPLSDINDNSRFNLAWCQTFNGSTHKVFLLMNNTIYTYSISYTSDITNNRSISLAQSSESFKGSVYFEKPWYKDNIVRVNATDEEIKQFFEDLTRGTSMQLTKDQMTII